MKASIIPQHQAWQPEEIVPSPGRWERFSRHLVHRLLTGLERGRLTIDDHEGRFRFGKPVSSGGLDIAIEVHDPRFYSRTLLGGHLGAAESYIRGYWSCDDLTGLVRLIIQNQHCMQKLDGGLRKWIQPLLRVGHWWRSNTRRGSRRNIMSHYDLGNDFYERMLDPTMTYSSGIYLDGEASLQEASVEKYDRLCRRLQIQSEDHVLEIGTGWGGFAIHAARHYGCRVTTTTISRRQYDYARQRVEQEGLSEQVVVLLRDYRDLEGRYDKLVSIEMIEAVGHQYYDRFFETCGRLLAPDGSMAIQAITIGDHHFKQHTRTVDFIKKYVFPGSCIPSIDALTRAMATSSDLRPVHLEDITPHYARTLYDWRMNVQNEVDEIRAMGYSEAFLRLWEFYLSYCEASFTERYNRCVQMVFVRPESQLQPLESMPRESTRGLEASLESAA